MIDPTRLARAVHLDATLAPAGCWLVGPYRVDLKAGTCECRDFQIRAGRCKHQLAAELHEGLDQDVRLALRLLVPPPAPRGATK